MTKSYRDYIYDDYEVHLGRVAIYKNYDKERKVFYKYFMKNYYRHLPQNKDVRIIDIGCGRGTCLASLVKAGYKNSEGIDLSESNVDFCCSQSLNVKKAEGLEYLNGNPDTFDVIIFNDVIEHLNKNEIIEMLLAMKSSLKDKGLLIVKTVNMSNPYTGISGLYMDLTHETGFTEISFKQLFHSLSFTSAEVFGADIYVLGGLTLLAKAVAKLNGFYLYIMSCLYGRKSMRIFEKNLICVARK